MPKLSAYARMLARVGVTQQLLRLAPHVRIDASGEVIGTAPDAVEVSLGNIATDEDCYSLFSYLEAHPSPETW